MKELAIKGHKTRGNEVIELLEMLGGKNDNHCCGGFISRIYFINEDGYIENCDRIHNLDYFQLSLEEFFEKFPYKVGDKVWLHYENSTIRITEIITHMRWCNKWNCVLYDVYTCNDLRESAFTPYKEETMTIDDFKANTKEWLIDKLQSMSKDNALQTICNIYDELHKPKYPKTYEECCMILQDACMTHRGGYKGDLMQTFQKLLICRNTYWKIAGEEMGLGKPWELYHTQKRYVIRRAGDKIIKSFNVSCVLEFPTVEMRDTFYENFKDLIEQCKELL